MALFRKTSLRFRLNLFCMAINLIIIICIAAGIGFISNRMLRQKSVASLEQQATLASERLDALLDRVENASLHFVVNEAYKETYETQKNSDYYDSYLYSTTITSHLLEFLSVQKDIYSMAFFTYDGKSFYRAFNEESGLKTSPGQERLIETFLSDGYSHHWYVIPREGDPSCAEFVFIRKMYNLGGHLRGILSLTLAEKSVTGLFPSELSGDAAYVLLFPQDLYSPTPLSGTPVILDDSQLMVTKPYDRLSANTATLVSKASVYRDSYVLVTVIIFIGIGALVLSFLVFHQATRYFLAPLELIVSKVKLLSQGDYSTRIHAAFHDELGSLANQIDQMAANTEHLMEQIRTSEERKKEYEVAYLQMQMRPHFLYNTLENLCGMVAIGENSTAVSMIHDISQFYRAVLNQGDSIISLKAELDISEHYMRIMDKRYPAMFTWDIQAEDHVMDCCLPKLTLQPLLENSIIHAFASAPDFSSGSIPGKILISCVRKSDRICLTVMDNGSGMTKEQLNCLSGESVSRPGISFGIRSIEERLRLNLGDSVSISIDSAPGKGTVICLLFPVKMAEDHRKDERKMAHDVSFFNR